MKRISIVALMLAVLAALFIPVTAAQEPQTPEVLCEAADKSEPETRQFSGAEEVLEEGVDYYAIFCTGTGAVYVDLFEDFAPVTVNNFVFLAQQGYYNNTNFHRVIQDFMAQAGDPTNTGGGDPGYSFADEFVGFLSFDQPGLLAMANAGPGTNGSQFFITTVPTPHLDFRHTIFGKVLSGQENVEAIELRDPATASGEGTTLDTVVIVENPLEVDVDLPELATPATPEEIAAALAEIGTSEALPEFLQLESAEPTPQTTEEVVASAPEAAQAALSEFLTGHGHEYRIGDALINTVCDMAQFPVAELRYTLDVFANAENAQAAIEESGYTDAWTAMGLTKVETDTLDFPVLSETTTACDTEMTHAVTFWQRGRFVVTGEITYQPSEDLISTEELLVNLVEYVFEPFLSDVLRPEMGIR